MLTLRAQFAFVVALAGLLCFPAGNSAQNPQPQEQVRLLGPPERAAVLAQVPSGQAVVMYQNGELTIMARNAPLIEVLRAVCSQTGAVLDIPSGADERIFAILGPGRASEVLASLLKDSQFNYAMVGSAGDPNGLARVIVSPKTKDSKAEKQVTQPQVSPTRAASIGEKAPQQQMERYIQALAETARLAEAAGDSEEGEGNAPDANALANAVANAMAEAVGSAANSPQVAPPASAAGSDTPAANSNRTRPSPPPIQAHRRR